MDSKQIRKAKLARVIAEEGTIAAVAEKVGTAAAYLSQILSNKTKAQVGDALARRIEVAYDRPHGWMDQQEKNDFDSPLPIESATGDNNLSPGPKLLGKVPLVSWVRAGHFCEAIELLTLGERIEWVDTTVQVRPRTFALRVAGDSMTNPNGWPSFPEGTIIVVEPEMSADSGRFVVVRQNGDSECSFKQLVKDGGRAYLKPLNPRYPILEMLPDAVICGVVREGILRLA